VVGENVQVHRAVRIDAGDESGARGGAELAGIAVPALIVDQTSDGWLHDLPFMVFFTPFVPDLCRHLGVGRHRDRGQGQLVLLVLPDDVSALRGERCHARHQRIEVVQRLRRNDEWLGLLHFSWSLPLAVLRVRAPFPPGSELRAPLPAARAR